MTTHQTDEANALFADPLTLFSRATDQVSADLNGDLAILNLKTKTYFGLADVGAFIWQQLETPTNFAGLTQAVETEFEVKAEQCCSDVMALLAKLSSLGLLNTSSYIEKGFSNYGPD